MPTVYPITLSRTAVYERPRITSQYWTRNPSRAGKVWKGKYRAKHQGIDVTWKRDPSDENIPDRVMSKGRYFTPSDTVLVATDDGFVSYVSEKNGVLYLNIGDGLYSRYGHGKKWRFKKGDKVTAGQVVGLPGKTGTSKVHLHFAMKKKTGKGKYKYIDPNDHLSEVQYIYPPTKEERPPFRGPVAVVHRTVVEKEGFPWWLIAVVLWWSQER